MCIQIVLNFGPLARECRHLWCDNSPGETGSLMKAILMQMYVKHTHNEYIVSNNHINHISRLGSVQVWIIYFSELQNVLHVARSSKNHYRTLRTNVFFLYRLMWLIYLCNPNEPSQCLKPSTQGQSNKGAVGIGEVSYNLCHIFEDRVKISAPWGKNNSKRMDRSCNLVHGV